MLTLNLARIRTPHEIFEREYEPAVFAPSDAFRVVARVRLAFDIFKDGDRFRLTGSVRTTLELMCGRCLEPLTWPLDAPFDLQYRPREIEGEGHEREIDKGDFSAAYYDDASIDLGQLMEEQFHLSVPMKPLCDEGCQGLCPQCGTNRNRGTCSCGPAWEDPRFAALRSLKRE